MSGPRVALLPLAALLVTLGGCGGSQNSVVQLAGALSFSTLTTTPSASQTATLSNLGPSTVHINSVAVVGANAASFTETSQCVGDLKPRATCPIAVVFASTTPGTQSATLQVTDNGAFGGQTGITLSGTAVAPTPVVSLSSSTISFASLVAGSASPTQAVTLTNTGTAALILSSAALSGGGANLFTEASTCGTMVAVGASCTLTLGFSPLIAGSYTATLTLTDNAAGGTQAIALSGTGTPSPFTIDTTIATDWKISNGTLSLDWNSTKGSIFGMFLAGHTDNLVDVTNTSGGQPKGFYMDNTGLGTGTTTATYVNAGSYLDFSITTQSNSANAYTYTEHFILTPNDPGFHTYIVLNHATTDIAGSVGQVQW